VDGVWAGVDPKNGDGIVSRLRDGVDNPATELERFPRRDGESILLGLRILSLLLLWWLGVLFTVSLVLSFRTDDEKTDSAAAVGIDFGVVGVEGKDVVEVENVVDDGLGAEEASRELENIFFLAPFPVKPPSFSD